MSINPTTKKAYGVELLLNGVLQTVNATKEVILSAGAVDSPQILMLSGVGPTDHLTEKGIPTIMNLKVGQRLQDHVAMRLTITTNGLGTQKPSLFTAVTNLVTNVISAVGGFLGGLTKNIVNSVSNVPSTIGSVIPIPSPLIPVTPQIPLPLSSSVGQYAFRNTGPLTVPGSIEAVAFFSSKVDLDQGWPDTEILQSFIGSLSFDERIFLTDVNQS